MFGKVAVLMGGTSAERDLSLQSGQIVFAALQAKGIAAEMIDTAGDYISALRDGNFDRAFIALHGRGGEDGTIQGLLECLNIPYTGSGVLACALSNDKVRAKRMWQGLGLATAPFSLWQPGSTADEYVRSFGLPLVVKPVYENSIAVTKLNSASNFDDACELASAYGPVMIEQWIVGDEYTVCILGGQSLPSIQIVEDVAGGTQVVCPSYLGYEEEENLQSLAKAAFSAVGGKGWGSVDCVRDLNGDYWLLAINTVPGLAESSLFPAVAKVAGLSVDELVLEILSLTLGVANRVNYAKGARA